MSVLANTFAIRNGAYAFSHASQDLYQKAKRVADVTASIIDGGTAWTGTASMAFMARSEKQQEDASLTGLAFSQVADALHTLDGQLDQVNQLRVQADQLQSEIHMLEQQSWGTEDSERASIHSQISHLSYRKMQLVYEADSIERQANQTAGEQFHAIGKLADRLHYNNPDVFFDYDGGAPFIGMSKYIGNGGALKDFTEALKRYRKKFNVSVISKTQRDGSVIYYALVQNGEADGIRGRKYYFSNGENYEQVLKYVDPKSAMKVALKDVRGLGTLAGYVSIGLDTYDHLQTNIEEGRSVSHTVSEATVDVGEGVGFMAASGAASAWATSILTGVELGAEIGTFGGPLGTLIGAGVGLIAGVALSALTDSIKINGKSVNDHIKEGLETAIDGGVNLFKSGVSAISSIFH